MKILKQIWNMISIPLVAVILAVFIGTIIIFISGSSPIQAYYGMLRGSLGGLDSITRTLEKATPLIFSGLAVAIGFKAGLFNIGAQGQLLFGAITSAAVGFMIKGLPWFIHAPLALLAGGLAGALYGAIPGILKTTTGAHEVITTIMLNYVAINFTDYLADGPWKDRSLSNVVARTPEIELSAKIGTIGPIPIGFIIAVIAGVIIWWLLWRTTWGYQIRTVGLNPNAARYAGMRVSMVVILTMVFSGLLAGLGGAVETQGVVGRYQPGFNVGLGFDGITVALLGKTHPLGAIPAAVLLGAIKAGSSEMQFESGIAKEITDVIQALILFFIAADMIVRWIIRRRVEEGAEKVVLSTGWGKH